MVVIFKFQLFYKKRETNMVLNELIELICRQKGKLKDLLYAIRICAIMAVSIGTDLTKLQIECKTIQGIANNDVINKTKLRKLGNLKSKKRVLNHQIDLCYGFVCGMMIKRKIKIQPLNMVFN